MARLFALCMVITACAGLPNYPDNPIYRVDLVNGVCDEFRVADRNCQNPRFEFVREHPLAKCNGVFGFDADGITAIRRYISELCVTAGQRCR